MVMVLKNWTGTGVDVIKIAPSKASLLQLSLISPIKDANLHLSHLDGKIYVGHTNRDFKRPLEDKRSAVNAVMLCDRSATLPLRCAMPSFLLALCTKDLRLDFF